MTETQAEPTPGAMRAAEEIVANANEFGGHRLYGKQRAFADIIDRETGSKAMTEALKEFVAQVYCPACGCDLWNTKGCPVCPIMRKANEVLAEIGETQSRKPYPEYAEADPVNIRNLGQRTQRAMADALKQCKRALTDELAQCSQEEIQQHPTLKAHQRTVEKAERVLRAAGVE